MNKGVAYADGKILVTTLDTHVYALDAKSGRWCGARNGDPKLGQTMTARGEGHDKVIVGISGGEYGVAAFSARSMQSGKLWRATNVGRTPTLFDPAKTIDGASSNEERLQPQDLEPGRMEAWQRNYVGLVYPRSATELGLLRHRQSRNVESRSDQATTLVHQSHGLVPIQSRRMVVSNDSHDAGITTALTACSPERRRWQYVRP